MRPLLAPPLLLLALLAACGGGDRADRHADRSGVTIDLDSDKDEGRVAVAGNVLEVESGNGKGRVALNLPGGIGGSITLPAEIMDQARLKVGGVGLYPGAKLRSLNVRGGEDDRDVVTVAFAAPAAPATVADWYQQQFADRKVATTRQGETLAGTTDDGDRFTLALAAADTGSTGTMTIIDAKK